MFNPESLLIIMVPLLIFMSVLFMLWIARAITKR